MINWICDRCGTSWGPSVSVCGCSPPTYTPTTARITESTPDVLDKLRCSCTCEIQDDDEQFAPIEVDIEVDKNFLWVLGDDLTTMRLLLEDAGYTVTKEGE